MRRSIAVVGVRKTRVYESSNYHLRLGPQLVWSSGGGGIAAQRADRIRRSFVLLKRCCALHRLALLAPARTARPLLQHQPHAVAAPRAAASAILKPETSPPKSTAAKSAMKTNAHNFIHACHMNTACVVIVLAKLIRAPVSSRPPLCYPSSPSPVGSVGCQRRGRPIVGGAYV